MRPDIEKYRHHMRNLDLDKEKESELIHTVWNVVQNGFDRALGNDPVQVCLEAKAIENDPASDNMVLSSDLIKNNKQDT